MPANPRGATRYLVHTGLHYPLNPDAPREEWQYTAAQPGDVVDNLPAVSLPWLLEREAITVAGKDRTKLPEGFPGHDLLVAAGITTYADVERRFDELGEIRGIGTKTLDDIRAALVAADDAGDEEEG
jgi:hypothetical protein